MTDRLNQWVVYRPWLVLITLLLAAAASFSLFVETVETDEGSKLHSRISFSSDYRIFFSEENPELQAFDELQSTYTKNDNVLIVLDPKQGDVFTADVLSVVEAITEEAWSLPYSLRVDSLSNYQHTEAEQDDLIVADLAADAASLSEEALQRIRRIALNEPTLVKRLVAEDAEVTAVMATIELPGVNNSSEVPEVVAAAQQIVDRYQAAHPDIDFYLSGRIVNNNAFKEASLYDLTHIMVYAFCIAIGGVALFFWYTSGSLVTMVMTTFSVLVLVFVSILVAEALATGLGIHQSPPMANAPTMILTLAIADSIHILVTFFQQLRLGKDRGAAMLESLRVNHQPVFLTSLTTSIGFLSLNFSDAPPFNDLGNTVAMGVALAWILSITLLPALMMILPVRVTKTAHTESSGIMVFANWLIRHYRPSLYISTALIVLCAAFLPANELNDVWSEYFDESMPARQAADFTREELTGLNNISYNIGVAGDSHISAPEYLQQLEAFADWYRQQPEVVHVDTFTDVMKRLNKNMHEDDDTYYRIPENNELGAQYLLLYELSLPFGLDLTNQVNIDKSATRLNVSLHNISTNELLALQDRAKTWLDDNAEGITYNVGSSSDVMFAHIGYRNVRTMLEGTLLALLLISIILGITLRSVRYGLISLAPNLMPAMVGFGLWGMFVGQVGLGLSVAIGMTLGIVVDYTVHFMSKYLRAKRENHLPTEEAIRYAFSTVGVALFVTTLILFANFGVLAFSYFALNAQMGIMTAMTIVAALLVDFFFLAPFLLFLESKRQSALAREQTSQATESVA